MTPGRPVVVVADGDAAGRKLACDLLGAHGFAALGAADGGDAVALAVEHRPALVLLDLRLPGVVAAELLAALRAHPLTAGVRVAALTASTVSGELERCRAAGFDGVVEKPIRVRDFPAQVRALCVGR